MAELTKEQVETAARWFCLGAGKSWDKCLARNKWRSIVHEVTPLVQLPWNEPTKDEIDAIPLLDDKYDLGYRVWTVATKFVRLRNGTLAPQSPPDPIRAAIVNTLTGLRSGPYYITDVEALADRIMTTLAEAVAKP